MPAVALALPDRIRLKTRLFDRYDDWSSVLEAVRARGLVISRTAMERFFSGKSDSRRTLRHIATLLHTTPDALLNHTRMASTAARPAPKPRRLRNREAFRIAYQLWVELTTRKLGLPIDLRHDLVIEIYDSWYAFFKVARELIKAIPLHNDPDSQEMRQLVELSRAILNEGIRPHLEHWQARYRAWHVAGGNRALSPGLTPQEMQCQFPDWDALSDDLLAANQRLCGYLDVLEVAVAEKARRATGTRPKRSRK